MSSLPSTGVAVGGQTDSALAANGYCTPPLTAVGHVETIQIHHLEGIHVLKKSVVVSTVEKYALETKSLCIEQRIPGSDFA
jgi:hypothetical protein